MREYTKNNALLQFSIFNLEKKSRNNLTSSWEKNGLTCSASSSSKIGLPNSLGRDIFNALILNKKEFITLKETPNCTSRKTTKQRQ